ncbi:hypothetical protein WA538_003931, partial [Blastocystis sp. DL]
TCSLEGFPNRCVHYCIVKGDHSDIDYENVNNDRSLHFVAVNPVMVFGLNHLLVACMKAINREETGKKFISGDINREIMYSLSPSKNLKEIMKMFCPSAGSPFVLLVSLESEDAISSFIKTKGLEVEKDDAILSQDKPEAVKQQMIHHFGITEEELSFYSLADLVQMGV